MIEPTDEMVAVFLAAWNRENRIINESAGEYVEVGARDRAGLAAVLALVERDYEPRRCDDPSWAGQRCTKPRGHDGSHKDRFSLVVWP